MSANIVIRRRALATFHVWVISEGDFLHEFEKRIDTGL